MHARNGSDREQLLATRLLELKETTIKKNSLQGALEEAQAQGSALTGKLHTVTEVLRDERERREQLAADNKQLQ